MAKPPIRKPKKKVCLFCQEKVARVDYKDTATLRKFISDRGKIRARRVSGNCTRHQVVPSVPARDLDHIAGGTQARDLLGEDELHRRTAHRLLTSLGLSEPCSCTGAAPSRGRS